MIKRGDADFASIKPGDALAVGRDCNLSDGAGATAAGKDLIELGGSGLGGNGLRGCGLGASEERRDKAKEDEGAE